jgi:hypothetical protein
MAPGKWRVIAVSAAAVAAVIVAGVVLTRQHVDRQKYPVPVPPPGASARTVVLAYLHSLDAHDSATAEQLSTAGFRPSTRSWLRSTAGISHIKFQSVTHYARQREYDVNVTFSYASHPWARDDSFPDGSHFWGYTLIPRHGRLLISGDGTG